MDYNLIIYLALALIILVAFITIFNLADRLGAAEFERDLANYELKKLRAYRAAKETYDSQG